MELRELGKQTGKWLEKYKYLVLVVIIGIVLMLIPTQTSVQAKVEEEKKTETPDVSLQLAEILAQVKGAGKVEVMLTLASGEQTIYQTDDSQGDGGTGQQDTVIVTDQSRGQNGLIQQVNAAKYRGAIVVCQGADNASVRLALMDAVSKVTGLDYSRISVLKMK